MLLERLLIHNFRNLEQLDFRPGSAFNLISGPNGSGKTSVLEAISYLALARSFRSANAQYLIRRGQPSFEIFARVDEQGQGSGAFSHSIGVSRGRSQHSVRIRIDGSPISRLTDLVSHLCVQVIHPQGIELITGGPELRRRFIDWGLYYAEPEFKHLYAQYHKALKQRNALLRSGAEAALFVPWDALLSELSVRISALRSQYVEAFEDILLTIVNKFLCQFRFSFELYQGFENAVSLAADLGSNLEKDRVLGYTSMGCHRADLKIKCDALAAGSTLSRGQLKLLVCAMRMAQSLLFKEQTKRNCIFLIDDLNSELDRRSQEILLTHLEQCHNQVFIANIEPALLFGDLSKQKIFELQDGHLAPS